MAVYNDSPKVTYTASGAIPAYRLVKRGASGVVSLAATTEKPIGVTEYTVADGDPVEVVLLNAPGRVKMMAGGAIAENAAVYCMGSTTGAGRIDDAVVSNEYLVGYADEAATAAGDIITVIPTLSDTKNS